MTGPERPHLASRTLEDLVEETAVQQLLARSHALGADPRITNYGGGNTSCKTPVVDPITGQTASVLCIKGSGGDLGSLTPEGLAFLRLDRVLALADGYTDGMPEDGVFGLLDHCRFGVRGAAPSIDTFLHALLPNLHVDHMHPDSVISIACARDGEQITKECFGDEVGWLPWRRPGIGLAVQLARAYRERPTMKGLVLGGHGMFAWGDTSEGCEGATRWVIDRATGFLAEHGGSEADGTARQSGSAVSRRRAAQVAPIVRGLCSTDRTVVGSFDDSPAVLDFLAHPEVERLVELGTSCPDHLLRTKLKPLILQPDDVASPSGRAGIQDRIDQYRSDYTAYYLRYRDETSPPMRGADPAIVLLAGVGMLSFGLDAATARITGDYYRHAINVMRGAEALSSYVPISEAERFGVEYWQLEEAKLRRAPVPAPLQGRVALVTGAASGIGRAIALRLGAAGAALVLADIDQEGAARVAAESGGPGHAVAVAMDVSSEDAVEDAVEAACLAFGGIDIAVNNAGISLSRPLLETTLDDWNRQHDIMATGSFLVSRAAARLMISQGLGGDIVYVVSKNSVTAAPDNVAYAAAKADQAHQVRLLAAELGQHGIRVNGVNPDGVVRGSGIFASGWGAERAAIYGVAETDLGTYYAERTLLKREILPEHVASAVYAIVAGDLALTTGCSIPVDGGIPAAFLR